MNTTFDTSPRTSRERDAVDSASLRSVLSRFATGVTVVTARLPDGPVGLTANAFTSVSLDPPLILVCLSRASRSGRAIRQAPAFAVSVLQRGQLSTCRSFAAPSGDRFADVPTHRARTGAPIVSGSLAYLDCRLHRVLSGGDHVIVLGEVLEADVLNDAEPLVFFRGSYR